MTTVKAQILKLQFHQPESAYVEFDFLLSRGASIGVYGRKNAVPTLTQNDLREVIAGVRARNGRDAGSSNQARTSNFGHSASGIKRFIYQIFQFCFMSCGLILRIPQLSVAKTASYFLPSGHWFLSLYNDDGDANEVSFVARVAPELTRQGYLSDPGGVKMPKKDEICQFSNLATHFPLLVETILLIDYRFCDSDLGVPPCYSNSASFVDSCELFGSGTF